MGGEEEIEPVWANRKGKQENGPFQSHKRFVTGRKWNCEK
jgi:hypothetical protein